MTLSTSCLLFLLLSQPLNKLILIRFWGVQAPKRRKELVESEKKNRGEKNWGSENGGSKNGGSRKIACGALLHYTVLYFTTIADKAGLTE